MMLHSVQISHNIVAYVLLLLLQLLYCFSIKQKAEREVICSPPSQPGTLPHQNLTQKPRNLGFKP